MSIKQRLSAAMSPAAMIMAIFALVVGAAGAGYAAGKIGTNDIQDNAVTSEKVKNGTLKATDMVKEKKFTYLGGGAFNDGGQGDCIWQSAHNELPGLPRVGYRTDRFGMVHLSGLVIGANGPGGDATCSSSEIEDAYMFRLPEKFRPRKAVVRVQTTGTSSGTLIIPGRGGLNTGTANIPAGMVVWTGTISFGALLDGMSFPGGDTKVYGRDAARGTTSAEGRALLKQLGFR